MILFWVVMLAMVLAAMAVVIAPLTRQAPMVGGRREANLRIVQERLSELENDHQLGTIDQATYQQLRTEVERTALQDIPQQEAQSATAGPWRWLALLLVVSLPLGGLVYYHQTSYRGQVAGWLQLLERHGDRLEQAIYRPEAITQVADGDLPGLIRVLQSRVLAQGKQDPDSLYALGLAYLELDEPQPALVMLEQVLSLEPDYPDARLAYARGMIQMGSAAFRAGDYQAAIDAWHPLLAVQPPDSPTYRMIEDGINAARANLAGDSPAPASTPPAASGEGPSISVTVSLDPSLAQRISPEDTLFVFARAAQGPPMPLLVERRRVEAFPMEVVLDENDAMLPSLRLADTGAVVVGARVSRAGDAIAQPGDLEGLSGTIDLAGGSRTVALTIDQVVP